MANEAREKPPSDPPEPSEMPTMPPPSLPEGAIIEVLAVSLANDPRAE